MNVNSLFNSRSTILGIATMILASLLPELGAQSTFGSIRGTARDESGAAVPQASMKLHNIDENTNLATLCDGSGNYVFENLKPGHYRLTAAKEGFASSIADKLELTARQDIRLDLKLAVAGTRQ